VLNTGQDNLTRKPEHYQLYAGKCKQRYLLRGDLHSSSSCNGSSLGLKSLWIRATNLYFTEFFVKYHFDKSLNHCFLNFWSPTSQE